MLKRSNISEIPEYYGRYIEQVDDLGLLDALQINTPLASEEWLAKADKLGDKVYEPGKWTIKQLIQHIIDAERVFAYRALRISRGDKTPLPGFDEGDYVQNVDVQHKTLKDLVLEFNTVRLSTMLLFLHMDDNVLKRKGNCSGIDTSVLALGFTIAGHQIHHLKVIEDRYFPLLKK